MLSRTKENSRRQRGASAWVALATGFVAISFLVACGASVPEPTKTDLARAYVQWPDMAPRDLATGRSLYVGRCGSCHRLERPSSCAPEVWPRKIDAMSKRAGLTQAEQELITRYVMTIADRTAPDRDEAPP